MSPMHPSEAERLRQQMEWDKARPAGSPSSEPGAEAKPEPDMPNISEREPAPEKPVISGLSALSDEEIEVLLERVWRYRGNTPGATVNVKLRAELARRKGGEGG